MRRQLIVAPRLRRGGGDDEGHATWLELFYDLVFVVAVSQVAERLEVHASLISALAYAVLFIPVWWAWIGAVFYANRFGSDDVVDRLFVLLQIAVVTVMAVTVGTAYSRDDGFGFPLAYASIRLILVVEYLRAGHYAVEARPVTARYAFGFGVAAALWASSVLVPPPTRYIFWGLGLIVDFATPISAGQLHARFAPRGTHLPERLGQFLLIVLGATFAGVVMALREFRWNPPGVVTSSFALVLAFGFWWLYFDRVDDSVIRAAREEGRIGPYQMWLYAHLPLAAGVAAAGVGSEYAITAALQGQFMHVAARWLLCISVAACYLALAAIDYAKASAGCFGCTFNQAAHRVLGAVVAGMVGMLGGLLTPATIMGVLALVAVLQVLLVTRTGLRIPPEDQDRETLLNR